MDKIKNLEKQYRFDKNLQESPKHQQKFENTYIGLQAQYRASNQKENIILVEYLGFYARVLRRLADSEMYFKKALALSYKSNQLGKIVQNLLRLGHVYQWQKQFSKATVLFDQVRSILNTHEISEHLKATYHQHLGKLYFDQKLYSLAQAEFQLALKIRKRLKSPNDQIESSALAINTCEKLWKEKPNKKVIIRRAEVSDAESVHNAHMLSINEICSLDHSPEEIKVWGGRSYDPNFRIPAIQEQFYLVVEVQGKIEGFSQMRIVYQNNRYEAFLYGFYITPKVLKKGVGKAMMKVNFEMCKAIGVELMELKSSLTALGFYKKCGFKSNGKIAGTLLNGVLIRGYPMAKILKN